MRQSRAISAKDNRGKAKTWRVKSSELIGALCGGDAAVDFLTTTIDIETPGKPLKQTIDAGKKFLKALAESVNAAPSVEHGGVAPDHPPINVDDQLVFDPKPDLASENWWRIWFRNKSKLPAQVGIKLIATSPKIPSTVLQLPASLTLSSGEQHIVVAPDSLVQVRICRVNQSESTNHLWVKSAAGPFTEVPKEDYVLTLLAFSTSGAAAKHNYSMVFATTHGGLIDGDQPTS